MALGDVKIVYNSGLVTPAAIPCNAVAAGTVMLPGEPVKSSTSYVIPSADAEPLTSAPTFVGIAQTTSDATASADGHVDVIFVTPTMTLECKAKSAAAVDTQAEIDALFNSLVLFDLTSSTYTVDTAVTGATNGLIIVGGDVNKGSVYFKVRSTCTVLS